MEEEEAEDVDGHEEGEGMEDDDDGDEEASKPHSFTFACISAAYSLTHALHKISNVSSFGCTLLVLASCVMREYTF